MKNFCYENSLIYLILISIIISSITCFEKVSSKNKRGLFPDPINLATNSLIEANATCGTYGREPFCKLTEHARDREPQCGVCDARSPDQSRRHPPENAIDGSSSWWQSPSIANGPEYEWITITLDLRQVYQVAYVIVKSANSPRPGNWILERSLDGNSYEPWQFYAISDSECYSAFGIPPARGRPAYNSDDEVICTSYFSKLNPLEGGEIHTSLINGRPGANDLSEELQRFTEARYVRLRLQKIRTLHGDLQGRSPHSDPSVTKRYFYSIKDISIGGRCVCNGHAEVCDLTTGHQRCACAHNTCGDQCDECCPLYNQHLWQKGNFTDGAVCNKCQCFGHATDCRYDEQVGRDKLSLDTRGHYKGGGICKNCQDLTTGINCDRCIKGYYRPQGMRQDDLNPCRPCTCSGHGTTGECAADDSQINLNILPGSCICKEGFEGVRCQSCAEGYLNFPLCEPCPCSRAGSENKACTGECICKVNVMGQRCDTCKPGTFHLDEYNKLGCAACYCNNVTSECEAAKLAVYTITERGHWKVTDLLKRQVIAAKEHHTTVSVEHDQMSAFEAYYWLAPQDYLGERLTSYGQKITIKTSWAVLRGDTSGKANNAPEIIVEGGGHRIAFGGNYYPDVSSLFLEIPFYEQDWYHFPKDLDDIRITQDSSEYNLGRVTRQEMMEILSSLESLMIRARYSSVQAESFLHDVILEYGKRGDRTKATLVTGAVERCSCQEGYTGLSCESCTPGYRRVNNLIFGGVCRKCECNRHVISCDAFNGECGECLHNTIGRYCEACAPGYFGDATKGTPEDCLACLCPLSISLNHFIPRCESDSVIGGYKCTCPPGYDGRQCERCAGNYFGNPLVPGKACKPCDCSGNVDPRARGNCDEETGHCLKCRGNTYGPKCEKCKQHHYGNPLRGQCLKCGCNEIGSASKDCEEQSGQCPCKPHYTGRQCEKCVSGRGGVTENCPKCRCIMKGSVSRICDPVTGQCPCKPGVGGRRCGSCIENHFGQHLRDGCRRCDCHSSGSVSATCDIKSGQCPCRPNVVGRTCGSCKTGFWGLSAGLECSKCHCDEIGSVEGQCSDATGQCHCRPGVGGSRCERCQTGYWDFSRHGCKPCEPCGSPGRNCDPNSGRCVCPPFTQGDRCERCSQGYWQYSADIGCRPCSCSGPGSLERQCDSRTGRCVCKKGFVGDRCDRCSSGHFQYPECLPCNCNREGTDPRRCRDGRCQCDENGQCPCKEYVEGISCNRCVEGTFGLSEGNPDGCFRCFCFKKSSHCYQAERTWSPLALPGKRYLTYSEGETSLNVTNQLYVIPENEGDVTIGTSIPFLSPVYWQLPAQFMRDKVRSYNGYLRFRVQTEGSTKSFPEHILQSYPLISLQGNWKLVLEYYPDTISPDGRYSVRLHEDHWRLKNNPSGISRGAMMIALQNIQHILIRATSSVDFTSATLSEVTIDVATEGTPVSSRKAFGVEQCVCPEGYSGPSCQDPSSGFYRWRIKDYVDSTVIINLVGEAKPCQCNGRAEACDEETGVCRGCRDYTAGPHCDVCSTGYYGDPDRGRCKPCACPSRQQNFAQTCKADPYSGYICHCRNGYTGNRCKSCADGYFGDPVTLGGSCKPCKCDPNGSIGKGCDPEGKCRCKPGITGKDCSQCAPRHVVSEHGCISCENGCVDVLLDDVEEMIRNASVDLSGYIPAPWPKLRELKNQREQLASQLEHYESRVDVSQNMVVDFDLDFTGRVLLDRIKRVEREVVEIFPNAEEVKLEARSYLDLIISLRVTLGKVVSYLNNYAIGESPTISIAAALDEAEQILKEMRTRRFDNLEKNAIVELERSKDLLERVMVMQQNGDAVDLLAHRITSLDKKVSDLLIRIKMSRTGSVQTSTLNDILKEKINRIKAHLERITDLHLYTEDKNFNATRYIKKAQRNLEYTFRNLDMLSTIMLDLQNKSAYLSESEAGLWQLNIDYKIKYVEVAEDHALHLKAEAIRLEKQFNETRDVADGPLQAAQAYQRIIDAINAAEQAARNASEAARKAYYQAFPGNPQDSIVRRSSLALQNSKDLRSKGDSLQFRVTQLSRDLEAQRRDLFNTKSILDSSNRLLDSMDTIIRTQFFGVTSLGIRDTLREIDETKIKVERTLEHVISIKHNLTIIRNYASQMSDLDSSLLQEIRNTISNIKGTTMKGERLSNNLRHQSGRIETRGNNLHDRIEALKRRIEQTRQYASSIRVSLTTDENGQCTRKYRPFLQPSTTSRLTLGYAINTPERDAMLLFMGSANQSDYMAVEMRNRLISFTWNAGGGSKTIVHPLKLQTNNPKASDESRWYHITANRVGNIGELTVRPAFIKNSNRMKLYLEPVRDVSTDGFSRMDLKPTDFVWIGGVPDSSSSLVSSRHFAGCLHYVTIDGEPLGLWNFTESFGCDSCNEGFELQASEEDKTAYGLNGKGYFKGLNQIRRPKPYYSVILSFKSLDEDALLFLAANEGKNQFFSIGLENGRVSFTVQFSERTKLVLRSEKRFNNLQELIQIQATVQKSPKRGERMGRLVVGDQDQVATIKDGPDLDLDTEPFFFGGVEPEFDKDRWGKQIELRSLLGCMGGLSVLEVGKNPRTDGKYYGFDNTCPDKPLSDVGFLGQGFLELPSKVLRKDSNFGFTFKTMRLDALLMVSTFIGQPLRGASSHPPDHYSVSLVEGHLDLRLYSGSAQHRILSKDTYNDGKLHSFFVSKQNRKVRLFIDDQSINGTRLERGRHVIEAPSEGGLYFGGIPPELNLGSMVGSSIPLKGCIQDVIINDRVEIFNAPIRFDNAFIGRCADLPRNAMVGMESDMKEIVSCQPPKQHTVEYGALKFGDQSQSHVIIPVDKRMFKMDFQISFEFRTFYPSGLFILAYNQKIRKARKRRKTLLFSAELQNGRLVIIAKNNRRERKIVSPISGLNSGEWRKVTLEKNRKKIRVYIDDKLTNKEKISKRNLFGDKMFLGGFPPGLANVTQIPMREPFRGCLRNLVISKQKFEIPSYTRDDQIVGVGQCFANVQPGSYFPGDAYAVYDNFFQVGQLLELRMEFRTWELNGVLLSVADPKMNVALSLELLNGAIVLTVDVGHMRPFSARVSMDNRYSLCDNQWHTIKAHYIKDSLTLRVDRYPEAYGFNGSNNLKKILTEAPLFIGGLPESAPSGTLSTRENFKGCIRNIVLDSDRKDWTDMFKLHNVLLNACPVL